MPRAKGEKLASTIALQNKITEFCKEEPRTYGEIALYLQVGYQTAWRYGKELIALQKLVVAGRRDGADLVQASEQRNIPHIPSAQGPRNIMDMLGTIVTSKGNHISKILHMELQWAKVISGIMRTSVVIYQEGVFPKERHTEYEKYLRTYKEELALRLQQISAILETEKFWTKEGLEDFQHDPRFDVAKILEAYQYALEPVRRENKE